MVNYMDCILSLRGTIKTNINSSKHTVSESTFVFPTRSQKSAMGGLFRGFRDKQKGLILQLQRFLCPNSSEDKNKKRSPPEIGTVFVSEFSLTPETKNIFSIPNANEEGGYFLFRCRKQAKHVLFSIFCMPIGRQQPPFPAPPPPPLAALLSSFILC